MPPTMERITTDVLAVGGGVAALRAAVAAAEAGARVVLCCKGVAGRSGNTVVSTADISAYIADLGVDDSEAIFASDTLDAGANIADPELVRLLAARSGPAVLDLERLGIPLLRDGDRVDRTRGAGHSRARTYRADAGSLGANKGLALSVPLAQRARDLGVQVYDRTPVIDLVAHDGRAIGAVAVDTQRDALLLIDAGATIVASGGASHLFARTNGTAEATGDVVALALRAGAVARDLEFVQWHPTRMDAPVPLFLTNGLLADGAVFRDARGREFMADYDPRGSLAPRDVLAKSIYLEAQSGRGVDGGVYLDCSAIPKERIALRHAYLAQTLQKHGVDFPRQWLVVSPSTHFLMGGIAIDPNAASSLPGLYAAGEAAGGIHGANRLGGNAFCEGLVFGTIAGTEAAAHARAAAAARTSIPVPDLPRLAEAPDPRPVVGDLWRQLREAMWQDASLVRDGAGLGRVRALILSLRERAAELRAASYRDLARVCELSRGLDCALAIVAAARMREESRGAHWRADFPQTSPRWFGNIWVRWPAGQAEPSLDFRPIADPIRQTE